MTTEQYKAGDMVVFLCNLGTVTDPNDSKFSGTVLEGEMGVYYGKHPNKKLDNWHLIKVINEYVPVHISQIRKAA
jgi:hypothetical protein